MSIIVIYQQIFNSYFSVYFNQWCVSCKKKNVSTQNAGKIYLFSKDTFRFRSEPNCLINLYPCQYILFLNSHVFIS